MSAPPEYPRIEDNVPEGPYELTVEEREWADELRDEFIILTNEHFTNVVDPTDDTFLKEFTLKLTEALGRWIERNEQIVPISEDDDNITICWAKSAGIIHAIKQARNEIYEYINNEFGEKWGIHGGI